MLLLVQSLAHCARWTAVRLFELEMLHWLHLRHRRAELALLRLKLVLILLKLTEMLIWVLDLWLLMDRRAFFEIVLKLLRCEFIGRFVMRLMHDGLDIVWLVIPMIVRVGRRGIAHLRRRVVRVRFRIGIRTRDVWNLPREFLRGLTALIRSVFTVRRELRVIRRRCRGFVLFVGVSGSRNVLHSVHEPRFEVG